MMTWREYTAQFSAELKRANDSIDRGHYAEAEALLAAEEERLRLIANAQRNDFHRDEIAYTTQIKAYAAFMQGRVNEAFGLYRRCLELCDSLEYGYIRASSSSGLGNCYHRVGQNDKAIECIAQALTLWEQYREDFGVATECGNMANVLMHLAQFESARDYMERCSRIFEQLGELRQTANAYLNLAVCLQNLKDLKGAYDALHKGINLLQSLGDRTSLARAEGNLGTLCYHMGDAEEAVRHIQNALREHTELGNRDSVAIWKSNLGWMYGQPGLSISDPVQAEQLIREAIAINSENSSTYYLANNYESLAEVFEHNGKPEAALDAYKTFHRLSQEYQSQKARELAERQDAEFKLGIERARVQATEQVLHRVLPASIAERLTKGEEVADHFDSVSVFFSDIVGFTPMASRMSAHNVIGLLNYVFEIFDTIMEKHGCEKIKTIGDGYMAISGAPIPVDDHAERLAAASVELLSALDLPDHIQALLPDGCTLQLRIGLHCGPAFAGIVGINRFVYDLYSDTINTAARMESHGLPGRIHCSAEFADELKRRGSTYDFEDRGIMVIKGKGEMHTYFLNAAAQEN